ncbi:hypothetical protein GGG16DRAFT_67345 [Schizophyllum commune]
MSLPFTRHNVNKQMGKLSFISGSVMRPPLLALFGSDREALSSQQKMLAAMSFDMNDVLVTASYPMHKGNCREILDSIGVILTSPMCLTQYNVMSTCMNIVIIALRSVGPHEKPDQFYHGIEAMLTTLQNAMTAIKTQEAPAKAPGNAMTGVEATTAPAESSAAFVDPAIADPILLDPALATSAAAPPSSAPSAAAPTTVSKSKRNKKKEKVASDNTSTPSVPSKRSAMPSADGPPAKIQVLDVSDTAVAHFGPTGLTVEGLNGTRLIEHIMGPGAQLVYDSSNELWARARVVSSEQYSNGDLHPDSIYRALQLVTNHMNTSVAFLGTILAMHEKWNDLRQGLQSMLCKASRRDEHLRRDPSEEADVPGSRCQGVNEGPYQADYERVRDIRNASPESRHILETVELQRFLADKKPVPEEATASTSAVSTATPVVDAQAAMEVDVPAVEAPVLSEVESSQ